MIDEIFVSFENSGKVFTTYDKAYFHGRTIGKDKRVYYIFTPTGEKFKRVSELEKAYKNYFKCDYFDYKNNNFYTQLDLKGLLL